MRITLTLFILLGFFNGLFSQSSTISELVVQGNSKTKSSFILRLAKTKIGSSLDSALIEADIVRFKRLPGIVHAYYQVHDQNDGNYKVVYGFEENHTLIPYANIYTSNDDEFAYRLGLQESNAFGSNISIGGYYQKDIFSSYGFNFSAPNIFTNKLGFGFNFQDLTTREPVFLESGTTFFKYNNTSFELIGNYEPNFKNKISLGAIYFTETYLFLDGIFDENTPRNFSVNKFLYKATHEFNTVDFYYQYLDGIKNIFNFQYVTSTNKLLPEFLIFKNDFHYYKRLGTKGNWASRFSFGLSSNTDSPFAPFSVDNNLNIRGVGNTIDRGTGAIIFNTEYRYSFLDKSWFVVQANLFIDAGTWRNPGGDLSDFSNKDNFRLSPGLGLRFIHKRLFNTVLRADYGIGLAPVNAPKGFVIGVGQYF